MRRRAVFLDRDGVLNEAVVRDGKPYPPKSVHDTIIVPEAATALERLRQRGFLLLVATNQPDVARGRSTEQQVREINGALAAKLPLDDFFVCYHDTGDNCGCRKPRPGLLLQGAAKYSVDLKTSYMIGDRWGDVDAGAAAGCKTILIDRRYDERRPTVAPASIVGTLNQAVDWILQQEAMDKGPLSSLRVKVFADGANLEQICASYADPLISGFTTNPTLMWKAGIRDYEAFARSLLAEIKDRPISFEVFSDEFDEMEKQALKIASWGENVFAKIPVTNTRAESSVPLIKRLSEKGVKLNVTALMTVDQVRDVAKAMKACPAGYISVFAGRVADTGRDPIPIMQKAVEILYDFPNVQLIWASPRELLNVFQADAIGCHVITATNDILCKLKLVGKDLLEYSLETVKMFREDAVKAGFSICD